MSKGQFTYPRLPNHVPQPINRSDTHSANIDTSVPWTTGIQLIWREYGV